MGYTAPCSLRTCRGAMLLLSNTDVSLLEQGELFGCREQSVASFLASAWGGLARGGWELVSPSWGSLWAHTLSWRIRRLQQDQSRCFCSVQAPVLVLEGICIFAGSFSGSAWGICKCCLFLLCPAVCGTSSTGRCACGKSG